MKQDIIINSTTSETRIALLEEDQLVELFVERPENERMVGSLYKGVVRRVMVGMSAAFVDIGWSQDAFLHFSDVGGGGELLDSVMGDEPDEVDEDSSRKRYEGADLKVGEEIIVQVIKEPIGRKGPRVSSQVSLPGRSLVLIPNETYVGVSRKIPDFKEKRRLKQIAGHIKPKGFGVIIRTLAEGKTEEVLRADLERTLKTWLRIERDIKDRKGPGLVYQDLSMASSILRDLFSPEVNSLIVDSRKLYREMRQYLEDVSSNLQDKVQLYKERAPIFDAYGIENEIEKCLMRKIWLNGGGYIYFDATEALVAIDVNSGRFVGKKDHEENSLKVNLKAAREICRQLRLRDVGGIIVIDFIDMSDERNRRKLFEEMRRALRMDRAKWDIAPISPFGLMEMTRQRIRPSLLFTFREPCPHCEGTGMVSSLETVITILERWIKRFASHSREHRLALTVNPRIKNYLTGGISSRIARIMWSNRIFITLQEDDILKVDEFRCYSYKQKREVTADYLHGKMSKDDKSSE
ncbi:MAG: Rne/Rng family ribonuclease [Calditrichota bacterium]